jgi:hypothetical protein
MPANTFNKYLLSASTNGKQIPITGTASPGNTVHVPTTGTGQLDEVYIYAINNGTGTNVLNVLWGGTLNSDLAQFTAYVYDNSASVSGYAIACAGAANSSQFALFTSDSGATKSDGFIWRFVNVGTDWVQGNKPATGGYFSVNRTSSTQIDMYFGNSSTPHFDLAPGGGGAQTGAIITDQRLFAFALNSNGSPASYTPNAISFLAVHQGLTASDSLNFFNAIQTLRIALGGGFR